MNEQEQLEHFTHQVAGKWTTYSGKAMEIYLEGATAAVLEYAKYCNYRDLQKFPEADFLTGDFYYL
jgi:hypothetical protein